MTVTQPPRPPGQTNCMAPIRSRPPPTAAEIESVETPTGLQLPSFRRVIVASLVVIVVFFVAVGAVIYGIGSLVNAAISGP